MGRRRSGSRADAATAIPGNTVLQHHLGWVVKDLERAQKQFARDGHVVITEPIGDPIQRVVVQFFRDVTGVFLWEIVAPLDTVDNSPLASRLRRGGGFDHVCYELEAADGALADVLAAESSRGGHIIVPPTDATAFGRQIAFVSRRSGQVVEFVETRRPGDLV
jgi:methylmalonyl-CoA/ethylmalonyl-CoA epimerase